MKPKFDPTEIALLTDLATFLAWGQGHYADGTPETDPTYRIGGAETLAHFAACFLVQKLGVDGLGTGDACVALGLDTHLDEWKDSAYFLRKLKTLYADVRPAK